LANELMDPAWLLIETSSLVGDDLFDRYICIRCSERCIYLVHAGNPRPKTACRNPEARARKF